jgi:hypothetical protein
MSRAVEMTRDRIRKQLEAKKRREEKEDKENQA